MDEKDLLQQPPITIVNQTVPVKDDDDDDDYSDLTLKEVWYLCLGHWYWFVLSIFACVGIASLYLLSTPNVYKRYAAIMLNDNGNMRSMEGDVIDDFGLMKVKSSVQNEIIAYTSPTLIEKVTREMHLEVEYSKSGLFHDEILYGDDLPITIYFPDLGDSQSGSCRVELSSDGNITVDQFTKNNQKQDGSVQSKLITSSLSADTLTSPLGRIVLALTPYYAKGQQLSYNVNRTSLRKAVAFVSRNFSADSRGKENSVIDLTFNDVHTQRAEDILSTVIATYNQNWMIDRNQIAIATSRFINERLQVIEQELGNVESDISSFKSENLLPDANAAAGMYMNQAQNASQQLTMLNNQMYMARYIRQYVLDASNQNQLLPANSGFESATANNIISQYNAKQLQRSNLIANSSSNSPVIQDIDNQLNELRGNLVASIDNDILSLQTQIQSQQRTQAMSNAQLASNPDKQQYLLSVERQQKVKESLYLFLLQKREENELSQAFTAYNTRVITAPTGSNNPIAPDSDQIILIAVLIGLIIPLAIILLREMTNSTLRGRKDLERLTIPIVGELPEFDNGKNRKQKRGDHHNKARRLVITPHGKDVINEAFRIVRSNLSYMVGPKSASRNKVILVTSSNPNSGKTFISANLAASFAILGSRVALVDLDLRKRTTSHYVDSPRTGLTDYLNQQIDDWHSILNPLRVGDEKSSYKIDIIPVGHRVPNPSELLQSPLLTELIDHLKAEYDYIILDCPPSQVVADVTVIKPLAELTLFIARVGIMRRDFLPQLERDYKDKIFNNLTLLLNGAEFHAGRYGSYRYGYQYGYGYGYGYDYGYGYGYDDHK